MILGFDEDCCGTLGLKFVASEAKTTMMMPFLKSHNYATYV
jgi:hypothetical protein